MKNNKEKKVTTLTFKLWLYFVTFAVSIFVVLWFMQVIFLQSYYSSMKKNETQKLVSLIEKEYTNGDYMNEIDNIAYKNAASVFIFDLEGNIVYSSSSTSGQGNISQIPSRPITIDTSGIVEKILESSNKKVSYTINVDRFNTQLYVYGKVVPNKDACIVMVTSIDPIDATTNVIQSQLIYITIISLMFSSVISIFMSRRLSKPITDINENAKRLAKGNYEVKFEKAGYKEIDDLADTLNYATKKLGETDKVRKELIANVSHDLRTPLTMIKAYSEMIRDLSGDNKEKREEHLHVIINETDRLSRLVEDMMDLSKIESGLGELDKTVFNLSEIIKNITESLSAVNKKDSDSKFTLNIPNDVFVFADKTKIEQVIYNLTSNAINHSESDKKINIVVISSGRKVTVQVIDNGKGISKEDLPNIWNRYYKSAPTFNRPISGGTGLGLSIVKNILDKHDSDYGVESELEKGSCFWFDLEKSNKKDYKEDSKKNYAKENKKEEVIKTKNKIVVIGSANIDHTYIVDDVENIDKRNLKLDRNSFGGKGTNQAVAASRLGAEVSFIGCVGSDKSGSDIINNLKENKVNSDAVKVIKDIETDSRNIYIDKNGDNHISGNSKVINYITKELIDENIEKIINSDIVVMQLKMPADVIKYIMDFCNDKMIIVNLTPEQNIEILIKNNLLEKATYLIANEIEAWTLIEFLKGKEIYSKDEIKNSFDSISKKAKLDEYKKLVKKHSNIIITLGAQGSMYNNNSEAKIIRTIKIDNVIDTTGCGDTFIGALSSKISSDSKIKNVIEFANKCASLNAKYEGAQTGMPYIDDMN